MVRLITFKIGATGMNGLSNNFKMLGLDIFHKIFAFHFLILQVHVCAIQKLAKVKEYTKRWYV